MNALEILEKLIAFPSVVGQPNGEIVAWIKDYTEGHGATVTIIPGPEGDRANLFATLGPRDTPGLVLSGHLDVVPAAEPSWSSDPFVLRQDGTRYYGRGTSDMKGFIAAALAALPAFAAQPLLRPLHLAFSYDEEAGCRGVPHLIERLPELCAKPEGVIIGEPTALRAVRAHKGKAAARLAVHGCAGHSSRPDQGRNAIHAMAGILDEAVQTAEKLRAGPQDANFEPPYSSLQVGTIAGGQAVNIIPDFCVADMEARAIAGVSPASLLEPIRLRQAALQEAGFGTSWEMLSAYPALSLPADAPLAGLLEELTGQQSLPAVSFGSEGGLFQAAGIDAIICGPGDIARAHRPNEYIDAEELVVCQRVIEALAARLRT